MTSLSWVAALSWGTQALRLATIALLARWLAPADFGRFALPAAFLALLQPLVGQGVGAALMLLPRLERGHVTSALAAAGATGLAAMMLVLAAGWIPAFNAFRGFSPVILLALAPLLLLAPVSAVGSGVLRRAQDFRRIAWIGLGSEVLGSSAAIALAASGHGLWSLVFRLLVSAAVSAGSTLIVIRRELQGGPRGSMIRDLGRLGRPIAAGQALVSVRERLDEVIVGLLLGATALGFYSVARRCTEAVSALVPAVITNRAWTVLSAQRQEAGRFRQEFLVSLRLVADLGWPAFCLLGVLAGLWAPILLGAPWRTIGLLVGALALVAAVRSVVGLNLVAMIAVGHSRLRLMLEVAITLIASAAFVLAAGHGLVTASWVMAAAVVAFAPFEIALAARNLPAPLSDQGPVLLRALGISLLVGAVGLGLERWLTPMAGPIGVLVLAGGFMAGLQAVSMLRRPVRLAG